VVVLVLNFSVVFVVVPNSSLVLVFVLVVVLVLKGRQRARPSRLYPPKVALKLIMVYSI